MSKWTASWSQAKGEKVRAASNPSHQHRSCLVFKKDVEPNCISNYISETLLKPVRVFCNKSTGAAGEKKKLNVYPMSAYSTFCREFLQTWRLLIHFQRPLPLLCSLVMLSERRGKHLVSLAVSCWVTNTLLLLPVWLGVIHHWVQSRDFPPAEPWLCASS